MFGLRTARWIGDHFDPLRLPASALLAGLGGSLSGAPEVGVEPVGIWQYWRFATQDREPIASGGRAAVEWWGSWREQGQELTFAGVTVLRFDDDGKVVDHRDYDNHVERREAPYPGW